MLSVSTFQNYLSTHNKSIELVFLQPEHTLKIFLNISVNVLPTLHKCSIDDVSKFDKLVNEVIWCLNGG